MSPSRPAIAIVDDDESVCRALRRLVRSFNMDVETFPSGEAFLSTSAADSSFRTDCLIVDLQMPGMSGLELQARLTENSVPIVFITAYDDAAAQQQALAAGAAAFLRKPIDGDMLNDTLRTAMSPGRLVKG